MKNGTVSRRCRCTDPSTSKDYGASCPKLKSSRRHGVWSVFQELEPDQEGRRRRFRRGGFETSTKAQEELDKVRALLAIPDEDDAWGKLQISDLVESCLKEKEPLPDYDDIRRRIKTGQSLNIKMTVGEWLDTWLAGRKRLRRGGVKRYECDIRVHLKPHLGHLRLDKLRVHHINAMFDAINERNIEVQEQNAQRRAVRDELNATPWKGSENRARRKWMQAQLETMPPFRRITGLNTQPHIRDTLRAALNVAIAQQVMPAFNPAAHVELLPGTKPKALVWSDERIARWKETGEKPSPVMVWTPEQTGQFLDFVAEDRLYVFWRMIAFRGTRRGESCGVRWEDRSAATKSVAIATQLVQDGWEIHEGAPKTDSGVRLIALDDETDQLFDVQKARQQQERIDWGDGWVDTGRIFTQEDGSILHPGKVSDLFERLVEAAGLPPIRLHDLRHVAATLMLAAGVDIKVVSETLGHSDTRVTRDIYQAVLDDLARDAAEKVVQLVPRARPNLSVVADADAPAPRRLPRLTPPRKSTEAAAAERTA
ncbi:tyrosine-type recombinase/integrase [Streptomyces sp. H27-H1]|uniref:tyrosine-type recombinase/integrase n=1 Tax=unclassified Streptomyces TaxID=2593676 RepID=UPI00226F7FCC|nr:MULTISPECIES: tyrosine-type recombinase/integrase [unclassified Streptomyces]MCY0926947.1 tyrosine-type recombinase/integrase [Streptomyces sp. H27-H1]MCY0933211.1 tyrosine-type recombinase/integrase [Streptomyces sp. H34-S4]